MSKKDTFVGKKKLVEQLGKQRIYEDYLTKE